MKLTQEQKEELGFIREATEKLSKEQMELFKDTCHYLKIDEESQKSNWLWDYLFNDLNIESLEVNL